MRIVITKKNDNINFYLTSKRVKLYLFSQAFTKGVYEFFKNGRDENEIRAFNKWHRNPKLDKTISKIPIYTRFALREAAALI